MVAYFLRQVLQALLTWLVFLLLSGSPNGPTSCRGRTLRIGGGIKEIGRSRDAAVAVAEEVKVWTTYKTMAESSERNPGRHAKILVSGQNPDA